MKQIRDSGELLLTLDVGPTKRYDVIEIPVIQFIIGGCEGNDLLCCRKGVRALNMNGLCRDFDIKPCDGDNIFIDQEFMFNFIKNYDVIGKIEE